MHQNTKLTPVLRKQLYEKWVRGKGALSLRGLAAEYHVDKRVVSRIIERGRRGDFSVHNSINLRYRMSTVSKKNTTFTKKRLTKKR